MSTLESRLESLNAEGEQLYNNAMQLIDENGDTQKAWEMLKQGAGFNNSKCQYQLGIMYEYGDSPVQENYPEALKYYKQSIQQKHPDALYHIGNMHELGKGVPIDLDLALSYYLQSGHLDNNQAINKWEKLASKSFPSKFSNIQNQNIKTGISSAVDITKSNKEEKNYEDQQKQCTICNIY